jgi:hypothetical protein
LKFGHLSKKIQAAEIDLISSKDILWNKLVPFKVFVFAWKLLQNQPLTNDNMLKYCGFVSTFLVCVGG